LASDVDVGSIPLKKSRSHRGVNSLMAVRRDFVRALSLSGQLGQRHRDQLGEFLEVLGGGGEVEFITRAVRSA
jgi:hypothetical protein